MKPEIFKKQAKKSERGQAIILLAFAFIGLVAMVGLVTDTGLLLIEYGKLKRSVDAAAVAAAQEFRPDPATGVLNSTAMLNAARTFLQVNQIDNLADVEIHTCEETGPDRPDLCNPDPIGNPIENRKLVEVTARSNVGFAFLRVIGINSAEVVVTSIGEAATIDLVLLIDTSGSMAYETVEDSVGDSDIVDPGDDPRACNELDRNSGDPAVGCQPLRAVKNIAGIFVESLIYFGYDRVSVISMTQQATDINDAVGRDPTEVIPLIFEESVILDSIDNLMVYQPRVCTSVDTDPVGDTFDPDTETPAPGECLKYEGATYEKPICPMFEKLIGPPTSAISDPSSCPSSNLGGMMALAQDAFSGSGDTDERRPDSLWVTVMLASGPANASTPFPGDEIQHPYGYCPENTWWFYLMSDPKPKWCRDAVSGNERSASDEIAFTNPFDAAQTIDPMSLYDAEDYARDMADDLAAMKSGNGVTIYTIGLGKNVKEIKANGTPAVTCEVEEVDDLGVSFMRDCGEAEYLLRYISREAGDLLNSEISHGEYFYAPKDIDLLEIFEIIAQNIATKISE